MCTAPLVAAGRRAGPRARPGGRRHVLRGGRCGWLAGCWGRQSAGRPARRGRLRTPWSPGCVAGGAGDPRKGPRGLEESRLGAGVDAGSAQTRQMGVGGRCLGAPQPSCRQREPPAAAGPFIRARFVLPGLPDRPPPPPAATEALRSRADRSQPPPLVPPSNRQRSQKSQLAAQQRAWPPGTHWQRRRRQAAAAGTLEQPLPRTTPQHHGQSDDSQPAQRG